MNSWSRAPHSDEILPATRWVLWPVVGVLVAAFLILWGFPSRTGELWAWDIQARMTPVFMGSVYGAGAWFFASALRGTRWVPMGAGTLAASLFAGLMLVTTMLHWSAFNHGDAPFIAAASFWAWTIIYAASPFVVFALWVRNRRTDPGVQPADVLVAPAARLLAALAAIGSGGLGVALLMQPSAIIPDWPWPLTELTARVMGCFAVQLGIGMALLARDPRWRAWELLLRTMLVASTLLLIGALRSWNSFSDTGVRTSLIVVLATSVLAIGSFVVSMARRTASPIEPAVGAAEA